MSLKYGRPYHEIFKVYIFAFVAYPNMSGTKVKRDFTSAMKPQLDHPVEPYRITGLGVQLIT